MDGGYEKCLIGLQQTWSFRQNKINLKGIFYRTGASMREVVTIMIAFLALSQMASTVEGKSVKRLTCVHMNFAVLSS